MVFTGIARRIKAEFNHLDELYREVQQIESQIRELDGGRFQVNDGRSILKCAEDLEIYESARLGASERAKKIREEARNYSFRHPVVGSLHLLKRTYRRIGGNGNSGYDGAAGEDASSAGRLTRTFSTL